MLKSKKAWLPLPRRQWDRSQARHLASRLGYSVRPEFVDEIEALGPLESVRRFLGKPKAMPPVDKIIGMAAVRMRDYRDADPKEKRRLRKEQQKLNRESYAEYALAWYGFARDNAPQEKLLSFYQNVWVVAYQGVKRTPDLFDYQQILRMGMTGTYPELCRDLSRTRAMVRYLNLNQNKKDAPNENFARELFELFTLGEGNYTEEDIKEAARAVTGYNVDRDGDFVLRERQHDDGRKTIFGETGRFDLDSLIDLVFRQSAAERFLPREFCQYYMGHDALSEELIGALGERWKESGFDLAFLHETVLSSRLFYEPEFRGTMIKSPEHFYLGMLQDLNLDVVPLPRAGFRMLRQMGQAFFNPPNVRGWVGGSHWVNSATLAASQSVTSSVLTKLNTKRLNADEVRALEAAKAEGKTRLVVDLDEWGKALGDEWQRAGKVLAERFYAVSESAVLDAYVEDVVDGGGMMKSSQVRELLAVALNAPAYRLC